MSVQHFPADTRADTLLPLRRLGENLAGRALTALLALGFFALMDAAYVRVAWRVPINSDHASILLEADDVLRMATDCCADGC